MAWYQQTISKQQLWVKMIFYYLLLRRFRWLCWGYNISWQNGALYLSLDLPPFGLGIEVFCPGIVDVNCRFTDHTFGPILEKSPALVQAATGVRSSLHNSSFGIRNLRVVWQRLRMLCQCRRASDLCDFSTQHTGERWHSVFQFLLTGTDRCFAGVSRWTTQGLDN